MNISLLKKTVIACGLLIAVHSTNICFASMASGPVKKQARRKMTTSKEKIQKAEDVAKNITDQNTKAAITHLLDALHEVNKKADIVNHKVKSINKRIGRGRHR